jgi:hypothetical protein
MAKRPPALSGEPFVDRDGAVHAFALPKSMSAKDRQRAAVLLVAREAVADLRRGMRRTKPDPCNGSRRSVVIGVEDIDPGNGSVGGGEVEIDIATARKLIPLLLDVIGDELANLGVWLD